MGVKVTGVESWVRTVVYGVDDGTGTECSAVVSGVAKEDGAVALASV